MADAILLENCVNYRIGSLTAIEIHPGETDQIMHADDGIYPLRIPGLQLQINAMWYYSYIKGPSGSGRPIYSSRSESGAIMIKTAFLNA